MSEKMTSPENNTSAEQAGTAWLSEKKKEHAGLGEIIRSFFSIKSGVYDPVANIAYKIGGVYITSVIAFYSPQLIEGVLKSDYPLLIGAMFLTFGATGIGTVSLGTLDSMKGRKREREQKLRN